MRLRYRVAASVTACSMLVVVAACTSKPQVAGDPPSREINVAVQSWMTQTENLKDVVQRYESENPGYKVNLVQYADNQSLANFALQWSQNKSNQDAIIVGTCSQAVQFLPKKLIRDINKTDFFSGSTAREKFIGKTLQSCTMDGVQYAVPMALEVYGISANKKLFPAEFIGAGGEIMAPKTWDDLYSMAKKLTLRNGDKVVRPGMIIQWGSNGLNTMVAVEQAARGSFYKADGKTLTFDTPEMRSILSIWREGVKTGVFSTATFTNKDAGQDAYTAGQLPLLLQSAAAVAESTPTIGAENARFLPIPGSLENGSRGGPGGIIIPTAAKNPELALKFIKEGLMNDIQAVGGKRWGKLPVITEWFNKIDAPWKEDIGKVILNSEPTPAYPDLPKLQLSVVRDLQKFLSGQMDLDTFIVGVEKQISVAKREVKIN